MGKYQNPYFIGVFRILFSRLLVKHLFFSPCSLQHAVQFWGQQSDQARAKPVGCEQEGDPRRPAQSRSRGATEKTGIVHHYYLTFQWYSLERGCRSKDWSCKARWWYSHTPEATWRVNGRKSWFDRVLTEGKQRNVYERCCESFCFFMIGMLTAKDW